MVNDNSSNIIYLPRARTASTPHQRLPSVQEATLDLAGTTHSFNEVILKNRLNLDRMQKERLKSNRAILKFYRLK